MSDLPVTLQITQEHREAILERVTDALLKGEPVYLEWDYRMSEKFAYFETRFKALNGAKVTIIINPVQLPKEDISL